MKVITPTNRRNIVNIIPRNTSIGIKANADPRPPRANKKDRKKVTRIILISNNA